MRYLLDNFTSIKAWRRSKKRHKSISFITFFYLVLLCILIACSSKNLATKNDLGYAQPVSVYYGGQIYHETGNVTYCLPDDLIFVGNINNVGTAQKARNLDGNYDGYAYIDPQDDSILYFQWQTWDELIDGGKEPYLILGSK